MMILWCMYILRSNTKDRKSKENNFEIYVLYVKIIITSEGERLGISFSNFPFQILCSLPATCLQEQKQHDDQD